MSATLPSGFTTSLYFGVALFPYTADTPTPPTPTPTPLAGGGGIGLYRKQVGHQSIQPILPVPEVLAVPSTFKKVKQYPIIEIDPNVSPKLVQKISVDHILKPKKKSTKLQDILDDDEEVLMLI